MSSIPEQPGHDDEISRALVLIGAIEDRVPAEYRVPLFSALLGGGVDRAESERRRDSATEASPAAPEWVGIDLGAYVKALSGPGRLLEKALITLEIVVTQMGVEWMTPAEIERFLVERARATHVYRTNVSNALRRARGLVDRRRRGRAYEYRLTEAGAAVVEREIAILGPQAG